MWLRFSNGGDSVIDTIEEMNEWMHERVDSRLDTQKCETA